MGLRFAPLRCPVPGLGADLSGAGESYRHEHTEEESTDVGEERDTTAARARGVDQRGVTLEELVEEPAGPSMYRRWSSTGMVRRSNVALCGMPQSAVPARRRWRRARRGRRRACAAS